MALIRDRLAQVMLDKAAVVFQNIVAAASPNVPFVDVLGEVEDPDVLAVMVSGTDTLDDNLADGSHQYEQFGPHHSALAIHVAAEGYTSVDAYLTARRWRAHMYAADLLAAARRTITRLNMFAPRTSLLGFTQGGAAVAGDDIPTDCGPSPLRLAVGAVKGAAAWTPVVTVVHEGPATTVSSAITAAALTLNVANESGFPVAGLPGTTFLFMVDNECMKVTATNAGGAPAAWTVTRAQKGTAAAAHTVGSAVRFVSDENDGTAPASCTVGGEFPLVRKAITTQALSGQAVVLATGIGGAAKFAVDGMYVLLRDRTCPQKLTATCAAADQATVEDASVFYAGDYCIIDDNDSAAELVTVRDTNKVTNVVYFDSATAGTFTAAQGATLSLAFATINEGGAFLAADVSLTVAGVGMLPVAAKCPYTILVNDERMTVTGIAGAVLTVTRGVGGTVAVDHPDGSYVILCPTSWNVDSPTYNRATERGNQEWGIVLTAAADQITLSAPLVHSYGLAGTVEPLLRDAILVANGAGGNAGDLLEIVTRPDAVIERAD